MSSKGRDPYSINQPSQHRVLLSCTRSDSEYAYTMREILREIGSQAEILEEGTIGGQSIVSQLEERIPPVTITMVLIGPGTRLSLWVDQEIEISTRPTRSAPGAGLIGVVLENHEDFSKPYYDPELVPLRLHDRILGEYAILKKWTRNPLEISDWLAEADRRRFKYDPTPSINALVDLKQMPWSDA